MSHAKQVKMIRGQLRQIVKEIMPEILSDTLKSELHTELAKEVNKRLDNITTNVKETLEAIDKRAKDIQNFVLNQNSQGASPLTAASKTE